MKKEVRVKIIPFAIILMILMPYIGYIMSDKVPWIPFIIFEIILDWLLGFQKI